MDQDALVEDPGRLDSDEDDEDNLPEALYCQSQPDHQTAGSEQPAAGAVSSTGPGAGTTRPIKAKSSQNLRKGKWTVSTDCND